MGGLTEMAAGAVAEVGANGMAASMIFNRVMQPVALCNRRKANGEFLLPPDGKVQLVAKGVAPQRNPETGEPILQIVDDVSLAALLANARTAGEELLVDREHGSEMHGGDTEAMAWLQDLEACEIREDGLWGPLRFTDLGNSAVKGGRLRFLSPVFDWLTCEQIGDRHYRPQRLLSFGMTNKPNAGNHSLSNRLDEAAGGEWKQKEKPIMSKENETETSGAAASSHGATAGNAGEEVLSLRNRVDALERENEQLRNTAADALLTQHGVPEEAREGLRTLILANREQAEKTLKAVYPLKEEGAGGDAGASADAGGGSVIDARQRLFNKSAARAPQMGLNEPEGSKAARLLNKRAKDIGGDWDAAWAQANAELEAGELG